MTDKNRAQVAADRIKADRAAAGTLGQPNNTTTRQTPATDQGKTGAAQLQEEA